MLRFYFVVLLFLQSNLYAQTGTFTMNGTFTVGSPSTFEETRDGATLTVSANGLQNTNFGTFSCVNNQVINYNTAVTTATLSFSQDVNIASLCGLRNNPAGSAQDWIFTAKNNGSTVDTLAASVDPINGTTVNFGTKFVGVDEIEVTLSAGGTFDFAFDNIAINAALPVELISFSASILNNLVLLNWATATEINNYGFEIERSNPTISDITPSRGEGKSVWVKIGFVNGHGNSNSPKSYSFIDERPSPNGASYRLKQIDFDGTFEYSKVIEVTAELPSGYVLGQNYPNPFNPETTISFQLPEVQFVNLTIYDMLGKKVEELVNDQLEPGFHSVFFNGSDLSSGTYLYRLETDSFTQAKKMLLVK